MTDPIRSASRVLSIQDIDYQLPGDSCYHPAMDIAALRRIRETVLDTLTYPSEYAKNQFAYILAKVFTNPAAFRVWGIVFERDRSPYMVLRNTAFTQTTPRYRRVLLVKLDALDSVVPPTIDADSISDSAIALPRDKDSQIPFWILYIVLAGLTVGASLTFCNLLTHSLTTIH